MSDNTSATSSPQPEALLHPVEYQNRLIRYEPITSDYSSLRASRRSKKDKDTKGKALRGRNVGKLANLMEMPLDVFYEITSHIQPKDMLQLSRSSPYFRDLLTTKNARPYWRAARRTIDMPDCPPDLSEMQYAALTFERNCFACGGIRAVKVSYALKVRLCLACWDVNTKKGRKLMKPHNDPLKPRFRIDHIISTVVVAFEDDPRQYKWLFHNTEQPTPEDKYREKFLFYQPEFDAVLDEYLTAREDKSALEEFFKERTQIMRDTLKFVRGFSKWEKNFNQEEGLDNRKKEREKTIAKAVKAAQITAKLVELGYTEKDFPHYDRNWERLMASRGELTEKYWDTILFPKLKDALERQKNWMIARERAERLRGRQGEFYRIFQKLEFPPGTILPTLVDLLQSSFLTPFLEQNDAHDKVTEERVQEISNELSAFAKNFDTDLRRMFVEEVIGPLDPDSAADGARDGVLEFARTILQCRVSCCLELNAQMGHLAAFPAMVEHINTVHSGRFRHWKQILRYQQAASNLAERVLESVGLSKNTTVDELQGLGKIVCLCGKPDFVQPTTLVQLVVHLLQENVWSQDAKKGSANLQDSFYNDHDPSKLETLITLLPNDKTIDELPSSSTALGSEISAGPQSYYCVNCPTTIRSEMSIATAAWHMNVKHSKKAQNSDITSVRWNTVGLDNPYEVDSS